MEEYNELELVRQLREEIAPAVYTLQGMLNEFKRKHGIEASVSVFGKHSTLSTTNYLCIKDAPYFGDQNTIYGCSDKTKDFKVEDK